jgi:hypothetical protein
MHLACLQFSKFRKPIFLAEKNALKVVKAACALHNWTRKTNIKSGNNDVTVDVEVH